MLHYYAKDFFAPLIITGQLNTDRNLDVYVVNEKLPLFNVTVYLRIYQWQSFNEFFNRNITLDIVSYFVQLQVLGSLNFHITFFYSH